MERNFNEDRRFKLYGDKLFSIHASNNLIIETSYNNIDFCSNAVIFDGHVELNRVICNNISISNVSEISSNFVYVNNIDLPSNNKLKYNSVNNGYIRNTSIGIDNTSYTIGRSDAYFTYINVSGGDASFNTNLTINKDLRIDGTLTISNDLLINGNNFASIENSFNIYRAALEQNFYSAKIVTNDLSASAISISNNLVALKTAYFNDISINGQLLNNVLKVPGLFTIDPSGHGNASGTLIINGDLTVNGLQTSIASSVVDICDLAITLASNLVLANIQDLSSTNAGLDISNIASLKYNGTLWNFSGGQLSVQNKKVLLIDDVSLAKRDFDLSINEFKADFSSSFFALKRNIDNSYNATYSRNQITNKFILKSNFDISSTSLLSYVDSSYISKSTFTISYGDILTLMDTSYAEQRRVGALNQFDSSFNTFNEKLDISYLLNSVFEASHNKIKTDFDISFATINASNITTSASSITIDNINTKHFSQTFANSLWNQLGLDISFSNPIVLNGISNNGRVVALTEPANASNRGRLYVYEISFNGTTYSWQTLGLSSEIMVGQTTNTLFGGDGNSVISLSSDGRVVAVSDTSGTDTGQVRVFELSANVWRQRGQLINGKPIVNYKLGYNIALSGNGNILAASSRLNNGEVLVYELSANTNNWIQMGQDISGTNNVQQGFSMSLSLDGTTLAVGPRTSATPTVNIYRFNNTRNPRAWNFIGIINGTTIDQYFGWNIKLSSDGNTIVVGGIGYGAAAGNTTNGIGSVSVYKTISGDTMEPSIWTGIGSNTFSNAGYGVAWNGTRFVAVGQGTNSIAYSTDGISWTGAVNSTLIFSGLGFGIGWNGTRWVAVGTGTNCIAYSPNGINWTPVINSTNIFSIAGLGVVGNGTTWVAVGLGTNSIAYSSDGITWAPSINSTTIFSDQGKGVAWNGIRFVAVGKGINTIAHSTDGITWTAVTNNTNIFSNEGNGIAWNGSRFVAVGAGINSIAYSSDGITWNGVINSTTLFSTAGSNVAWNGSQWVAVGSGTNSIAYSSDGINWTRVVNNTSIFSSIGRSVAWNGTRWVALGIGTNTIAYSESIAQWSQLGQTLYGASANDLFGQWVQISNDGTIISAGGASSYVRVYKLYSNTWIQLGQMLNGTGITPNLGTPVHALSGDGTTLFQVINKSVGNTSRVYGINKSLSFIPSTTTISTTISGDLAVTGKAYLKSFRISNKHNFDVSINGYSSHYLVATDISASIVDYYSNVGYIYNKVFKIDACGNVSNYSGLYGAVSDSRLKENIVTSSPKLADLLKVRVVNYNLKGPDKTKYIGVLAQELEELFPELVVEDNTVERIKSVNYSNLTIMLIKAFQEQQVLINNLYASLEELEKDLEKDVDTL